MNEIQLPDKEPPLTIEGQLQSALYAASNYHRVTAITHLHRRAYIVPAWMYDEFIKGGAEARPKPAGDDAVHDRIGGSDVPS
mgnify:CR=1 FL=1